MPLIGKQPNGLFCVYSNISNGITMYNCSEEELVQYALKENEKEIRQMVAAQIQRSEKRYKEIISNLKVKGRDDFWHNEFSKPIG